MRKFIMVVTVGCLFSGCALFKPPSLRADGPTVPTGTYHSDAEKWADESAAAKRKAEKEKTERILEKLDRE